MKVRCRSCNEEKDKIFLKIMLRNYKDTATKEHRPCKRRVYIDESRRQWNGNECPNCKYGSNETQLY